MKEKQIKKLKEKLLEFFANEYGDEKDNKDMRRSYFSLAYTTTEDGNHEIQVEIDLEKFQLINKIDGHIYSIEQYTFMTMYQTLIYATFGDYTGFVSEVNIKKWLKEKRKERVLIKQIKRAIDLYNEEEDEMNKWLAARIYDEVLLKKVV